VDFAAPNFENVRRIHHFGEAGAIALLRLGIDIHRCGHKDCRQRGSELEYNIQH